jgi:translin
VTPGEGVPDTSPLETIIPDILEHFAAKNRAREQALSASRTLIRMSANSIRAVHRGEFGQARAMLDDAREVRDDAVRALEGHGDIYHAGFLHDAQKEYAEARTTLELLSGGTIPSPTELGVEYPAYLNGIAEAVGECAAWSSTASAAANTTAAKSSSPQWTTSTPSSPRSTSPTP